MVGSLTEKQGLKILRHSPFNGISKAVRIYIGMLASLRIKTLLRVYVMLCRMLNLSPLVVDSKKKRPKIFTSYMAQGRGQ
jgi:hypothetical protein